MEIGLWLWAMNSRNPIPMWLIAAKCCDGKSVDVLSQLDLPAQASLCGMEVSIDKSRSPAR
jgi:hypothetical protein